MSRTGFYSSDIYLRQLVTCLGIDGRLEYDTLTYSTKTFLDTAGYL